MVYYPQKESNSQPNKVKEITRFPNQKHVRHTQRVDFEINKHKNSPEDLMSLKPTARIPHQLKESTFKLKLYFFFPMTKKVTIRSQLLLYNLANQITNSLI